MLPQHLLRIATLVLLGLSALPVVQAGEFEAQFQAVLQGQTNQILLRDEPLTASQAERLAEVKERLFDLLLDAGLAENLPIESSLTCLTHLQHLRIRSSSLTNNDILSLAKADLRELLILNLPQSKITAAGIRSMQAFPLLRQLRLGGEQLDDAAVTELAKLPSLVSLHLIGPKLSDKALDMLSEAPKLASFYLDDCELPDEAWIKLFEAKPNLHVHIDQHHHDRDPHAKH